MMEICGIYFHGQRAISGDTGILIRPQEKDKACGDMIDRDLSECLYENEIR